MRSALPLSMISATLFLTGCLVNTTLYRERLDDLSAKDLDGDGVVAGDDCDDTDPAIFPGAEEVCDEQDNDCNGETDEGVQERFWFDGDGDGHGAGTEVSACTAPDDHVANNDDCDDSEPTVYEGAEELCDGLDNDCSGTPDDGPVRTFFADGDDDGHGTSDETVDASCPPDGFAPTGDDCDDGDPDRSPSEPEVCNGQDDDCDGLTDDGDADIDPTSQEEWWPDLDGDGFGDMSDLRLTCIVPPFGAGNGFDCNDADPGEGPPGLWRQDIDGDGYGGPAEGPQCRPGPSWRPAAEPEDCEEGDAAINPGALEVCEDGIDQNCVDGDARCHRSLLAWSGGDPSGAEASWIGREAGTTAGVVVSAAGDQNGDGRPDLAVGATGYSGKFAGQGAIYILQGPTYAMGLDLDENSYARLVGEAPGDKMGRGIAGGADLDGDGQDDLVAGAWLSDEGAVDAGVAYLVYGPVEGDVSLAGVPKLIGVLEDDQCCQVMELSDVNDDGQADLVIASEYATVRDQVSAGAVHVFTTPLGRRFDRNLTLDEAGLTVFGETTGDQAGKSLAVSDVDGDGSADLSLGAFRVDPSVDLINAGAVSLFYGGPLPTGMVSADDADARFIGEEGGDGAGEGLASGGDINGDGNADLLISARTADHLLEENCGKVYVVYGGSHGGTAALSTVPDFMYGEVAGSRIGRTTAVVKAYDGDIYDWLVIGADVDPIGGLEAGAIYILPGPIVGGVNLSDADRIIRGEAPGDQFGYGIANVGDVDRDGWEDILVSAYHYDLVESNVGKAYLIYGTDL